MLENNILWLASQCFNGFNIPSIPYRQYLRADDTGRASPGQAADDQNDVPIRGAKKCSHQNHKRSSRDRQNYVHNPHQNRIYLPSKISGRHADQGSNGNGNKGSGNSHYQRNPSAINNFTEDILADIIGSQKVGRAGSNQRGPHPLKGIVGSDIGRKNCHYEEKNQNSKTDNT